MNDQPTTTDPVIRDTSDNIVTPDQPDYGHWRDLHKRQATWEAAQRRPSSNPDVTANRQGLLAHEATWLATAAAVGAGVISPRAWDALYRALRMSMANTEVGRVALQERYEGDELRRCLEEQGLDYKTELTAMYAEAATVDAQNAAKRRANTTH